MIRPDRIHTRPCRICKAPVTQTRRERFCSIDCRHVWQETYREPTATASDGALDRRPIRCPDAAETNSQNK